jgi:hypothetical protein
VTVGGDRLGRSRDRRFALCARDGAVVELLRAPQRLLRGEDLIAAAPARSAKLMRHRLERAGRRHELAAALSSAGAWVLALTVVLQIVALLARTEAWHLSIVAVGATVGRRVVYRASSVTVLGSVLQGQAGSPRESPPCVARPRS